MPRPEDIYQERLYAIQWITKASIGKGREEMFFAAVTRDDLEREQIVTDLYEITLPNGSARDLFRHAYRARGKHNAANLETRLDPLASLIQWKKFIWFGIA